MMYFYNYMVNFYSILTVFACLGWSGLSSLETSSEDGVFFLNDILCDTDDSPVPPEGNVRAFSMDKRGAPQQKPLWRHWHKLTCDDSTVDSPSLQGTRCADSTVSIVKVPSGRLCPIQDPGGIFCEASALVWQSKMWGLEFAGKSNEPINAESANVALDEKAFVPDFAWRPGVKVEIGYDFAFDGWDLDSRWTYYRGESTHLKKHIESQINPPGLGVIPLWFYPFYDVFSPNEIRFFDGRMCWRHYFNSIDLEIGRLSALSKRVIMHLFAGLKGAWMHQYYRVEYDNGTQIDARIPGLEGTTPLLLIQSAIAFKNKTWGGGPRIGFDSKWKLAWGFSLIADGAFSLLYSKVETRRDQNDLTLNVDTSLQTPFHLQLETNAHQLKPVAEVKLGLDWASCIYQRSIIGFSIAYELQYWWAQNELRRNYSHAEPGGMFPMRGDLQMHGLTASVNYHY